ncbi:MAG: hypothetical protein EOM18_02610 [Clostridia bacterium]|nr:hypothetical protein [Clostridia bacterium]
MSTVMLRTQDKEQIINFNQIVAIQYQHWGGSDSTPEKHNIAIDLGGAAKPVGTYATRERCIEVIDEIITTFTSYLQIEGGAALLKGGMSVQPNIWVLPVVYKMPDK